LCIHKDGTCLFEIVHRSDPHIVEETEGAHYLGWRSKTNGNFYPDHRLPHLNTLQDVLDAAKTDKGEGFMVYALNADGRVDGSSSCKVKSDYYVGKKILMRATAKTVNQMFNHTKNFKQNRLPEMWHSVLDVIVGECTPEQWMERGAQERRDVIECILNNQ
jgi:hypothetical protein